MEEKKDGRATYTVTLTEEQVRVVIAALEEYFRLRMGQGSMFADDMAAINCDLSPENPEHRKIFDGFLHRRNHLNSVMQAVFQIAFEPCGYLTRKPDDMLIAEDIWDALRVATGKSIWSRAIQSGAEPLPEVVKNEG